jgi:hypothetical protein
MLGTALGFSQANISTQSLCAGGAMSAAMAALCAHVGSDTIGLVGRWYSNEMLRYLTIQVQPIMCNFSAYMLQDGQYTNLPNATISVV